MSGINIARYPCKKRRSGSGGMSRSLDPYKSTDLLQEAAGTIQEGLCEVIVIDDIGS